MSVKTDAAEVPTQVTEKWLELLAYSEFEDQVFTPDKNPGTRPYAAEIEELLAPTGGIGASAVFCVDEQPTVCFLEAAAITGPADRAIEQIRQRVWNQNLLSAVLVLDGDRASVYSVGNKEADADELPIHDASAAGNWSAYEVQSGFIKDRLSDWFTPSERVDQRLLANLRAVVKDLVRDGLSDNQAEALMAQVIFLCYLEQRGIVGDAYRKIHRLEVLDAYVSRQDGAGIDRLLEQLGADFNGDFLRATDRGAPNWSQLPQRGFYSIRHFLDAVDLETGQGAFWRYDFSHIPVELISGIYETLLKDRQGALGAYYTPRHLANLVTQLAFEDVSDPSQSTVYDGACGSGILLTTAFRKILRFAEVSQRRHLRFAERVALMQKSVFGNDVDETACWITAFSLYLSLLEGLEPSDISLLQSDAKLQLPNLIGDGLNIQKGPVSGDFFSSRNPFAGKGRFDVFLCNPPWRESADQETPTWEEWCRGHDPVYPLGRRQIAAGFTYRSLQCVKEQGVVALILPLNLVLGASGQSCDFRRRLLEEARIEKIINFADVRRLLFPAAKHPCAIVKLKPRSLSDEVISLADETIEYWTPKADVSLALGRLALHASDLKRVSSSEVYDRPYLLITSYWGERLDVDLINQLLRFGTVGKAMKAKGHLWSSGKGFHAPNQSNADRDLGLLETYSFIGAAEFPKEHPIISADSAMGRVCDHFHVVASPGGKNGKLYVGPRVLFPDGLSDQYEIRAAYTAIPLAFTSSIGAIGGDVKDAGLLMFLTAYLRSPLATYLLIMTGYSVIGERPRIALDDVEAFPFCLPEDHPDEHAAFAAIREATHITQRIANEPEWIRHVAYEREKPRLDHLVFEYFQLSVSDRQLITDTVDVIAKSIQPADYLHLATPLLQRPTESEISAYTDLLSHELSKTRDRDRGKGAIKVRSIVGDSGGGFFGAVEITADSRKGDAALLIRSQVEFDKVMKLLSESIRLEAAATPSDEMFKLPNVFIVVQNSLYFIKPLRRRFWLGRTAVTDADFIARTVRSAAWGRWSR